MAKKNNWDFSGWATKTNMRCSDGRTIKRDAFKGCDGIVVPLVWNHRHNDPSEVLGHALLENREDGVYAYCSFNDSEKGREGKELVRHGDIKSLSIYANQLVQSSKNPPCDVIHGTIREVSLVLAGANPGAFIDNVLIHGEVMEDEAEIFHGDDGGIYLYHADEEPKDEEESEGTGKTVGEVLDTLNKEQKAAVGLLIEQVLNDKKAKEIKHADEEDEKNEEDEEDTDDSDDSEETIGDIINTLNAKQRKAVEALVGMALSEKEEGGSVKHADEADDEEEDDEEDDSDSEETIGDVINTLNAKQRKAVEALVGMAISQNKEDSDEEEDKDMKHNAFDAYEYDAPYISHADQASVIELAQKVGSLKRAVEQSLDDGVLAHAITDHNGSSITAGIANIDYLFPDARAINNTPELIMKEQDWVNKVINGTHHTPFSRVKSLFADITGEDARARGYVKGNQKVSEVIEALQRETPPQTIYKLQKLDRDDILDITDFDVVAWLKAEMQIMLKAEIARAILIGDGRQAGNDKIKETNVRPIYNDSDVYTVKVPVNVASGATDNVKAAAIIDAVILSRKNYKGSGNPSFFINEDFLGQMLILKDGMGRRIYETEASLAAALRVKELIPVDVMENKSITISNSSYPLVGIIVNLQDYNVGADKGGQTSFFDDFDIDFNKFTYLYETRMSGALIKPHSAMSVYIKEGTTTTT